MEPGQNGRAKVSPELYAALAVINKMPEAERQRILEKVILTAMGLASTPEQQAAIQEIALSAWLPKPMPN